MSSSFTPARTTGPTASPCNFLRRLGLTVTVVDSHASESRASEARATSLSDDFYFDLLKRAGRGDFLAVVVAPPHNTFVISRFLSDSKKPKRNRENIEDIPTA